MREGSNTLRKGELEIYRKIPGDVSRQDYRSETHKGRVKIGKDNRF